MLSTWLFIILIGDAAQVIEVRSMSECLEIKQYMQVQTDKNEVLKRKVVTGCFRNLGERSYES